MTAQPHLQHELLDTDLQQALELRYGETTAHPLTASCRCWSIAAYMCMHDSRRSLLLVVSLSEEQPTLTLAALAAVADHALSCFQPLSLFCRT